MWKTSLLLAVIFMVSFTLVQAAVPCKDCDAPTDFSLATDFKSFTQTMFNAEDADNGQPIKGQVNIIIPGEELGETRMDVRILSDVSLIFPASISMMMDDIPCDPSRINLPLVAFRYESFFNCTVSGEGLHTFQLDTNNFISNNRGTYTMSYFTQDRPSMKVEGTDYISGDVGKIHLSLTQGNTYVNNRSCRVDAFYPNNTFFLTNVPMINIAGSQGVYYYDFVVPSITGVYPVTAECRTTVAAATMFATGFQLQNGTDTSGSFLDILTVDQVTHDVQETGANPRTLSDFYNVSTPTAINLSELQDISVTVVYSLHQSGATSTPSAENFVVMLKDYSTGVCTPIANLTGTPLANPLTVVGGVTNPQFPNLSVFFDSGSKNLTVCFQDTVKSDTTRDRLNIDFLSVNVDTTPFVPVQTVHGSSEINVMSWVTPLFGNITAISNATFACFVNETSIAESVWGLHNYTGNRTLNPQLNVSPTVIVNITINQTSTIINVTNITVNVTTETVNPIVYFNGTVNTTFNFSFSPNIIVNATFNVTANFSLTDFSSIVNSTISNLLYGYCPQYKIGKCVYQYFVRANVFRDGVYL